MITAILKIDDMEHKIIRLVLKNESMDKIVHIPFDRIGMGDEILDGDYFEFSKSVLFLGKTVKRLPYSNEELIELMPQETITTNAIRLEDFYDLSSVITPLQVRYKASTTLFPPEQMMIASSWAIFE